MSKHVKLDCRCSRTRFSGVIKLQVECATPFTFKIQEMVQTISLRYPPSDVKRGVKNAFTKEEGAPLEVNWFIGVANRHLFLMLHFPLLLHHLPPIPFVCKARLSPCLDFPLP